mmetsp:Transcript_52489/g.109518  ORF Transcript_52489/g.109518 Transcript_52489/m.109518 type:complete len:449 (-) Transcript_52489:504-1850(-)
MHGSGSHRREGPQRDGAVAPSHRPDPRQGLPHQDHHRLQQGGHGRALRVGHRQGPPERPAVRVRAGAVGDQPAGQDLLPRGLGGHGDPPQGVQGDGGGHVQAHRAAGPQGRGRARLHARAQARRDAGGQGGDARRPRHAHHLGRDGGAHAVVAVAGVGPAPQHVHALPRRRRTDLQGGLRGPPRGRHAPGQAAAADVEALLPEAAALPRDPRHRTGEGGDAVEAPERLHLLPRHQVPGHLLRDAQGPIRHPVAFAAAAQVLQQRGGGGGVARGEALLRQRLPPGEPGRGAVDAGGDPHAVQGRPRRRGLDGPRGPQGGRGEAGGYVLPGGGPDGRGGAAGVAAADDGARRAAGGGHVRQRRHHRPHRHGPRPPEADQGAGAAGLGRQQHPHGGERLLRAGPQRALDPRRHPPGALLRRVAAGRAQLREHREHPGPRDVARLRRPRQGV